MEERQKIGAHIRSLRKRTGLAQLPFANRAGMDRKAVYRIENADQSVGIDQFIKLYLSLGVSLSSLLADAASHPDGAAAEAAESGARDGEEPDDPRPDGRQVHPQ